MSSAALQLWAIGMLFGTIILAIIAQMPALVATQCR